MNDRELANERSLECAANYGQRPDRPIPTRQHGKAVEDRYMTVSPPHILLR